VITLLGVALASAIGAPARYLLDRFIARRGRGAFPWGTFAINVSGSFVLGLLVGLGAHHGLSKTTIAVLGTGFCGAYTTFSTFSVETIRLVEDGSVLEATMNATMSIAAGLLAAAAGLGLALAL
jgi:fluoride exporter